MLKTEERIRQSFIRGTERIAAWADLLDRINVFPVADGDTGRNLLVSLRPLRQQNPEKTVRGFLYSARGNSGNIAARFFSEFIRIKKTADIPALAEAGRKAAREAVALPRSGTMLSVFDTLADTLADTEPDMSPALIDRIVADMADTVHSTAEILPELREADVVDAGALGMFIFLETFFRNLGDQPEKLLSPSLRFGGKLRVSEKFRKEREKGHCITAIIRTEDRSGNTRERISGYGGHAVIRSASEKNGEQLLSVHLHTQEKDVLREKLSSLGHILEWSEEDMYAQTETLSSGNACIRILTDGAGSLCREDAKRLGITVFDSYILSGDTSTPESRFPRSELYERMRKGEKISTSQASVFERHQHYQSALSLYDRVLYLCVGSVYTGNYDTVSAWRKTAGTEKRFSVIDTGAASGRLGLISLAAARYSQKTDAPESVIAYAEKLLPLCEEYVFPDKLRYLAAGGRLSGTGAFFGDMLHMKPVISPLADGARKAGMVRNRAAQLDFARNRLKHCLHKNPSLLIMLEYTDNREWVEGAVQEEIGKLSPESEQIVCPLSLTSGVHMGPGTWGIAFVPKDGKNCRKGEAQTHDV